MNPSMKRAAATAKGAQYASRAVQEATKALKDEKTRQLLMDQGKSIAAQAQQWRKDRAAGSGESGRGLISSFGQARLERRVENIRSSLTALAEGRPELSEALAPVHHVVDDVALKLDVAGRMPAAKRKQAHIRIDRDLDELEEQLFEQTFGPEEEQP